MDSDQIKKKRLNSGFTMGGISNQSGSNRNSYQYKGGALNNTESLYSQVDSSQFRTDRKSHESPLPDPIALRGFDQSYENPNEKPEVVASDSFDLNENLDMNSSRSSNQHNDYQFDENRSFFDDKN
jgi:hypothetical protein